MKHKRVKPPIPAHVPRWRRYLTNLTGWEPFREREFQEWDEFMEAMKDDTPEEESKRATNTRDAV